jgi:antitoxin (DNA-binding transcriptional repressor) of toxin-antitoxin stability system
MTNAVTVLQMSARERMAWLELQPGTMDEVAARVADGARLWEIARDWAVKHRHLSAWVMGDAGRLAAYHAAQGVYADKLAGETIEIADRGEFEHTRDALRIRSRQWLAGKYDRARFGDAVTVTERQEAVLVLTFGGGGARREVVVESGSVQDGAGDGELI